LHAASAYKEKINDKEIIHLGNEFGFEHLQSNDLAVLYRILYSFHSHEEKMQGNAKTALFQAHLAEIEKYIVKLCWSEPSRVHELLNALKVQDDAQLDPIISKVHLYLEALEQTPTFQPNSKLAILFDISLGKNQVGLKEYLSQLGLSDTKALMKDLQADYRDSLKWLKKISQEELEEKDPVMKEKLMLKRSFFAEEIANRHMTLIELIVNNYSALFKNKLLYDTRGKKVVFMPDGMKIQLDSFKKKGTFAEKAIECESYEDYTKKLGEFADQPTGKWYFSIRCKEIDDEGIHQSSVMISKNEKEIFVFLIGGANFDLGNSLHVIANRTYKVFPKAEIYSTMNVRQRDLYTCGLYTLKNFKIISALKDNFPDYIKKKAVSVHKYLKPIPKEIKNVKVTPSDKDDLLTIPLDFMKMVQSLSQLNAIIKHAKENPDSINKLVLNKLERLKQAYTVLDFSENKKVYLYTKLEAIRNQLQIIDSVFSEQATASQEMGSGRL